MENEVDKTNENVYNKKEDTRYSYAGERAKTANLQNLAEAKKMLDENVSAEEIFRETGWFKGADGLWRFEINDSEAELRLSQKSGETL